MIGSSAFNFCDEGVAQFRKNSGASFAKIVRSKPLKILMGVLVFASFASELCAEQLYIANYELGSGTSPPGPGGITIFNTATNTVTTPITVGQGPGGIAVSPDGSKIYVPNFDAIDATASISVIDAATKSVIRTINVGKNAISIAITPNGSKLYVTHTFFGGLNPIDKVSVINTSTNSVISDITVGDDPMAVAITPDGSKAYVVNNGGGGSISVIDTGSDAVTATVNPIYPTYDYPRDVAVSPDGSKYYIVYSGAIKTVEVMDVNTDTRIGTISPGQAIEKIAISRDGSKIYLTSQATGKVFVVDAATNNLIGTINLGGAPSAIAVSIDGSKAYVSNYTGGTVSVIDTIANTVISTVSVGRNPSALAIGSYTPGPIVTVPTLRQSALIALGLLLGWAAFSQLLGSGRKATVVSSDVFSPGN